MNRFNPLIYIVFSLLINSCSDSTPSFQKETQSNNQLIDSLVEKGTNAIINGYYSQSQQYFSLADSLVTDDTDTNLVIRLLLNKTELIKYDGDYKQCLDNYFEVARLSTAVGDSNRLALAYYNIATTLYWLEEYDESIKYNLLSQNIFKAQDNKIRLISCHIQQASVLRKENRIPEAKNYLEVSIRLAKELELEKTLSICFNNLGNLLYEEEQYDSAIFYYENAAQISKRLNDDYAFSIRLGNIGESYLKKGKLNKAKAYMDSSLTIAQNVGAKETILTNRINLREYYAQKNQMKEALQISDSILVLKNELMKLENTSSLNQIEEDYKRELQAIESQNKIQNLEKDRQIADQQKTTTVLVFTCISLIFILLIVFIFMLYRKQKERRIREGNKLKEEKAVIERKNKEIQEEKEQLENELAFKRKEILDFANEINSREDVLKELNAAFQELDAAKIPTKKWVEKNKSLLEKHVEKQVLQIHERIEEINSSFHFRLQSDFPELTQDDLRLATLLLLGMSSKEISSILVIEPKSVSMKRYRLKKKLNLPPEIDLIDFLKGIKTS